jgi:hypothetical protein
MANFAGISAAGKSIERLLNHCFQELEPVPNKKTKAVLARTADFDPSSVNNSIGSPALSIFIYRVDFNKTMRAAWSAVASQDGRARLPLDLHFLISPWAENAEFELLILGRAMECLETTPVLNGPLLHPAANWAANETVQVLMEEVSTDALMQKFDSLPTDYRLSVPYIARIVRIDAQIARPDVPVTTLITGRKVLQRP